MSRVAPHQHYQRYQFLRTAWFEFPKLYGLLRLRSQWQLHEFYQPSKELTKRQLITHIYHLSLTKPALVHQAGKHSRLLYRVFRYIAKELNVSRSEWYRVFGSITERINPPNTITLPDRHGNRHFIVAAARPELDVEKVARGLLRLAEED